ncbi:uncharacterized protein IL334_004228 [Kwoniella shivajii]|uniref:Nitrogen regulatory protein areA GATA-like domain-containing protein n=1 Tax=Kwoniella shivajii TaxID=564305 RepID=A0ABZ1D056_9TREE|nr:hypothetical protein IL334_004228 [Kwoniella shivajii]
MEYPLPSPSGTSIRSNKPYVPLLSLAPPAVALGDELAVGEPGDDNNAGEIWNVITRAADLVKDGERLENLAWRHWGQPRRSNSDATRRLSMSSQGTTASSASASINTPVDPSPLLHRSKSSEKLTFGGALRLLLEKDESSNFKDWVEDAKKHLPLPPLTTSSSIPPPPTLSLPDTPVANFEIRLVEPTPVPSRVGSLGGSMSTSGLLSTNTNSPIVPPPLEEEVLEEEKDTEKEANVFSNKMTLNPAPIRTPSRRNSRNTQSNTTSSSPKKKTSKFFVQSSPSKGSGESDSSHPSHTSPAIPLKPTNTPSLLPNGKHARRRSSGDSSTISKGKQPSENHAHQKRHVSLSTMKGKYHAEKRRMAEQHSAKKDNEESGWEDEEEDLGEEDDDADWSDEEESLKKQKSQLEQTGTQEGERDARSKDSNNKNRRRSTSRPRTGRTTSDDHTDILTMLTRKPSHTGGQPSHQHKDAPPPPAPTPLTKMSKKERQRAAAERAKIEAQLEAQRQREMFAKQQIFGTRGNQGLLASALQRGASMVNLQSANDAPLIRPSPTHVQLPSLASSPAPGPSLLRSKSAVAMPVQTGVSVTVPPHALETVKEKKQQKSSQEKAKATVEMESSDEEESDADMEYLNNIQTKQKIAALAAKRDAKVLAPPVQAASPKEQPQPTQAVAPCRRLNEYGYVQPMSPTTRRRQIIVAEMSESLRRNVVLEREKSSGGGPRALGLTRPPPSNHISKLPTHHSAINLTQYSRSGGGGGGGEGMERTTSNPARASPNTSQPSSHTGAITNLPRSPRPPPPPLQPPPPLEASRRRTTPNVLGGGNFLKPLTRATVTQQVQQQHHHQSSKPEPESMLPIQRKQSTPSVNFTIAEGERSESPSYTNGDGDAPGLEAPAMMRRSTEGDELHKERERRRELARRRDTTDTSYRLHGW